MYSFIRRFINGAKSTNKVVCASLKRVRRIAVFPKRSVKARDVMNEVSAASTDTALTGAVSSSEVTDLREETAFFSFTPTSTDISHSVIYDEHLQDKRRTMRLRRNGVNTRRNSEDFVLANETDAVTENAGDITLSSCSNNEEEPCRRQSDHAGDMESWKIIGNVRKQRASHSDKLTRVKGSIFGKESIEINIKSPTVQNVNLETSRAISNKDCTTSQICDVSRAARKAKRVRFLVNGDRHYKGIIVAVSYKRYRSFDSLLAELSNNLSENKYLPRGVQNVFSTDGRKISQLEDLKDGKCYICSSNNNFIKKIDYVALKNIKPSGTSKKLQSANKDLSSPCIQLGIKIKPKMIFIVRNGPRPRKIIKMLLNKRNSPTYEHVLTLITESIKLDTGAVRKVYTSSGCEVKRFEQFFESDDVFFAYGSERMSQNDLKLDFEEMKTVQSHKRRLWNSKNITCSIPRKILNRYTIGDRLGNGAFGVVYRCFDKRSNSDYAIKVLKKNETPIRNQLIKNELSILKALRHPNIIHLISELVTPTNVCLITELVRGGDLFHAINRGADFSVLEKRLIITNLASALAYLHGMDIVHRDVKQENLLVEFDSDGHVLHVKLADFGLSQKVNETLYAVCGTPAYMAPEMLSNEGYGVRIDIWAAGAVLYKLLCGFLPFYNEDNNEEELYDEILRGAYGFPEPYWDNVSEEAKDLVCSMLQSNPSMRFSAENILFHPWCNDYEF